MTTRYGKYFYCVDHQKPHLADIPSSCLNITKKYEMLDTIDFKKYQQSNYQSSMTRIKSTISSNQNSNNFYNNTNKFNDSYKKRNKYTSNFSGGLNFDYNNIQIDSNYGSKNDHSGSNSYDKRSKEDNFFSNKISLSPPPGDGIFSNKGNKSNHSNYDANSSSRNYNDGNNTNYDHRTTSKYESNYDKYSARQQPKLSSIDNYDYLQKTSSTHTNDTQISSQTHHSKSSKHHASNAGINSDNTISRTKQNQNAYTSKIASSSNNNNYPTTNSTYASKITSSSNNNNYPATNSTYTSKVSSSNNNNYPTTNSTYASKVSSSSKMGSIAPSSKYATNVTDNNSSKYAKKTTVYDYSKPNPAGIYNPDSSGAKSYKSSSSTSTNIKNRNDFNIQSNPSYQPSSKVPSTISTSATTSSRQQYTSTSSKLTTNSRNGSNPSLSNQNTRFTTTSDLLNQSSQPRVQNQMRSSIQQSNYDDIRQPNLTQYVKPQGGKITSMVTDSTTRTSISNGQTQFIAHQAQYSGNNDISGNRPSVILSKKNAISNPGYDFLQSNQFDQSQSQSFANNGAAENDSFTIDPVPKKTRVEFPEPQTAPKPFQTIDASLEGEVSQEEAQKVEDLNDLMKSFHADSDAENDLDNYDINEADNAKEITKNKTENSKTLNSFKIEDLKKDLFSSLMEEEEEEAQLENEIQEENEKNNKFQPLEDLSVFEDIEQKSKDFDDQNIHIDNGEEEEMIDYENKLEIASSEDLPNDSTSQKDQKNIQPNQNAIFNEEEDELIENDEDLIQSTEIQDLLNRFKKSLGNEEEEDQNTNDFIKQLEGDVDLNSKSQTQEQQNEDVIENEIKNKEENQNEDKTIEDVFLEEEENESMIEKINANINMSDDDNNDEQISIEKNNNKNKLNPNGHLDNDFKLNLDNEEEEESENDLSIEEILKKASEQHLISPSDENYEEDEEGSLSIQLNKTPISHFKKPFKFLAQNITNRYSSSNNGTELAFEFADKILKKQLMKVLGL